MATIAKPNTFSAGATIIAAEHNDNFDTIYDDYNGGITNANISGSAAIAYSKLNLTNEILNADIDDSAGIVGSKLDLSSPGVIGGTSASNGNFNTLVCEDSFNITSYVQGDIPYHNGTSIVDLPAGTSGQFLKTQGAGANPIWTGVPASVTLFSFAGSVGSANTYGFIMNDSVTAANTEIMNSYWSAYNSTTHQTVIKTKLKKVSGIDTATIYGSIWQDGSTHAASLKVDIGGQNVTIVGTNGQTTPEWKNDNIDISSLSNGTVYDVVIQLAVTNLGGDTTLAYLDSIIAFGS